MKHELSKALPSIALSAVFLAATAWLQLGDRPRSAPAQPIECSELQGFLRSEPLAPLQDAASDRRRAPTAHEAEFRLAGAVGGARETWTLTGSVLDAALLDTVADVEVRLSDAERANNDGAGSPAARADALGNFRFELDTARWRPGSTCTASVADGAGRELFDAPVVLEQGLQLLVRRPVVLRGRVAAPGIDGAISVRAGVPPVGAATEPIPCGRSTASADGRFEITGLVDELPSEFDLHVSIGDRFAWSRTVPTTTLTSLEGALVELALSELECVVIDRDRHPIADAQVSLAPVRGRAGPPLIARTDGTGRALVRVPLAELEACVGKPGFASAVRPVDAAVAIHEFVLEPLASFDVVEGLVLFEDGSPASDVLVCADPTTKSGELASAGTVSSRTRSDGSFALRARANSGLRVRGFDERFGFTQVATVGSFPARVTLLLRPRARAHVTVEVEGIAGPFRSGTTEWVLVDRNYSSSRHGHVSGAAFELEDVPDGDYNLYVYLRGVDAFGQAAVRLDAREEARLTIAAEPANWVRGRVTDGSGRVVADCTVAALPEGWSPEVASLLAAARTDSEGRFQVLCGLASRCAVDIACSNDANVSSALVVKRDGGRVALAREVR